MALIQLDHTPETIKVCVPLYMILPDPGNMGGIPVCQRKLLYLLHGLSDNGSAWQRYSSIETLANAYGLVVVMPSFGRSFYADMPNGQQYFTYLIDELPQYLKDVFGLDPRPEDTLIAGNSMGGYGAFKAALNYPEKFGHAASFSGALSLAILSLIPNDPRQHEFELLFGDLSELQGSQHDTVVWLQNAAQRLPELPSLYLACGKQDDLFPLNQIFYEIATDLGITLTYATEDGGHNWQFWDKAIRQFLKSALGDPPEDQTL